MGEESDHAVELASYGVAQQWLRMLQAVFGAGAGAAAGAGAEEGAGEVVLLPAVEDEPLSPSFFAAALYESLR